MSKYECMALPVSLLPYVHLDTGYEYTREVFPLLDLVLVARKSRHTRDRSKAGKPNNAVTYTTASLIQSHRLKEMEIFFPTPVYTNSEFE